MTNPRGSRTVSAEPNSPATVEKRDTVSVFLPISLNSFALVYLVMSYVTVKVLVPDWRAGGGSKPLFVHSYVSYRCNCLTHISLMSVTWKRAQKPNPM